MRISDWSSDVCSSDLRPFEFLWVKIYSLCKIGQLVWRMLRPNYTKDLDLFRACSSYFLSRPAAIEIGRRVEHNHNIRINEPMPKHILERIAGPRSEEHTSEIQSLMRISYAVFCLKKK